MLKNTHYYPPSPVLLALGLPGTMHPSFPRRPYFLLHNEKHSSQWSQAPLSGALCIFSPKASHMRKLIIRGQCPEHETGIDKRIWVVLKKSFSAVMPETLSLTALVNLHLLSIMNPSANPTETKDAFLWKVHHSTYHSRRFTELQGAQPGGLRFRAPTPHGESCQGNSGTCTVLGCTAHFFSTTRLCSGTHVWPPLLTTGTFSVRSQSPGTMCALNKSLFR